MGIYNIYTVFYMYGWPLRGFLWTGDGPTGQPLIRPDLKLNKPPHYNTETPLKAHKHASSDC